MLGVVNIKDLYAMIDDASEFSFAFLQSLISLFALGNVVDNGY